MEDNAAAEAAQDDVVKAESESFSVSPDTKPANTGGSLALLVILADECVGASLLVVVCYRPVLFAPGGGSLSAVVCYRPVVLSRWWFATGWCCSLLVVVLSRRWFATGQWFSLGGGSLPAGLFSRRWFALGGDITEISWTFPHTPIRPTGNGPLPHTSSARNWFIGVMARAHSGTRAADINPEISARPPLPFSPIQGGRGGQAVVAVGQAGNLGRGFAATLPLGTEESSL